MKSSLAAILSVFLWWFAIIDTKGEIGYFYYDRESSCQNVRKAYLYSLPPNRVTTCLQDDETIIQKHRAPTNEQVM